MDTYEKKYKELESKIKKAYLYAQTDSTKAVLEDILPELKDNDDRIRKALITYFQRFPYPYGGIESAGTNAKEAIAWLEKQESVEEIVERCKKSWYNEGKIAGMAEGLSDDEKYQQGWHDAIEKKEEKVDNANKVEPKFKVKYAGNEYNVLEIKEIAGITYYGIEDEPNHIDYVLPENCEIISGYDVKEKGNLYPTKTAIFSEQNPAWNEEDEKNLLGILNEIEANKSEAPEYDIATYNKFLGWLESIKERIGG